jgi:hypothetical protein
MSIANDKSASGGRVFEVYLDTVVIHFYLCS